MNDSKRWNEIVTSFQQYDIYYLSNYVKAFKIHGDGEPLLLNYESDALRGINVFMKRDISHFAPFKELIEPGLFFDIITPYGYGGFLFEGDTSESVIKQFYEEYAEFKKSEHVVSEFVRYHPQLKNANSLRAISTIIDLGTTISIDLESIDNIWANFSTNNRNNIRKAEKSGIKIYHGKSLKLIEVFMDIYNETMNNVQADPYYYFERAFYESIYTDLQDNYELFYAVMDGKIIAVAIMLFANFRMHCHLMASIYEYRTFAPSNLLIYEAACWGNRHGFKTMHLGGGLGSEEDDLFRFKKSFNRNSDNTFSIGKEVFNQEIYDSLVKLRRNNDSAFDYKSLFFPLYRA
ncbi:MAG: GNAT family N-acetyltransferase [Bacteroidales bacterium]|nr:GNAT family N-acetyltransferase [Bacteroidales bacterium]